MGPIGQDVRRPGGLTAGQLAETLLEFVDLFPVPGSALAGHTEAVEHTIDTGDSLSIRCALRRMSPQKIKQEEACVGTCSWQRGTAV